MYFPIENVASFSTFVQESGPNVRRTTRRVLSDRKIICPVHQTKVLMVLHSDIYSVENLTLTYRRTDFAIG